MDIILSPPTQVKFLKNLLHGIYGFLNFNFSECNKDSLKDLLPALHAPKIYKHVRFLQRLLLSKKIISSWNICISENYPPSSIPSKLPKISQKSVAGNLWLFQFQFESIFPRPFGPNRQNRLFTNSAITFYLT